MPQVILTNHSVPPLQLSSQRKNVDMLYRAPIQTHFVPVARQGTENYVLDKLVPCSDKPAAKMEYFDVSVQPHCSTYLIN